VPRIALYAQITTYEQTADLSLYTYILNRRSTNKPQTIDALKVNITNAIQQIQPDLCEKVIENWTARICHQAKPRRTFE